MWKIGWTTRCLIDGRPHRQTERWKRDWQINGWNTLTHIHAHLLPYTHTCTVTSIQTYMHSYFHTHIHAQLLPYKHTCTVTSIHIHAQLLPYTHTCTVTSIHTYMHSYFHTHIHAQLLPYTHTCTVTSIHTYTFIFEIFHVPCRKLVLHIYPYCCTTMKRK